MICPQGVYLNGGGTVKDLSAALVVVFCLLLFAALVKSCHDCEAGGGIYVRGLSGNYCIDPSAVRPPR
jgi:hypothetical protein